MNNLQAIRAKLAARDNDPKFDKLRNKAKNYFLKSFKNVQKVDPAECPEISMLAWSYSLKEKVPIPDIYLASEPKAKRASSGTVTIYADRQLPAIQINADFIENTPLAQKEGILGHEIGHLAFRTKDGLKYAILNIAAKLVHIAGWICGSMAIIHSFGEAPGIGKKIGIFVGMFIATRIVKRAMIDLRISAQSEKYADRCSVRLAGSASGLKSAISSDSMKAIAEEDASHYKGIFRILPRLIYGQIFDIWENASFAPKNAFEKALGKTLHVILYVPSMSERLRLIGIYEKELAKDERTGSED
ncbi:MAG: M48 family metalloprotease [Candidatus Micrarchaeota archaeon]|nr:M48 family metalloprotease [Candidatus Micrarchaeota archaeon]